MTDEEIQREIEWEHSAIERGVRRYRASLMRERKDGTFEPRDLADLEPGQEIHREVVRKVHKVIEAAVLEARDAYANKGRGREQLWWKLILSLDPDKIAYIGVRSLMCGGHWATHVVPVRSMRSVALEIGRCVQTEREFELWRDRQGQAHREAKANGGWATNYWKLMRELSPEITERAYRKWSKKSGARSALNWTRAERLHLGIKVLHLIVETCPEWFNVSTPGSVIRSRYRTEKVVSLSDPAREWISKRHEYNELRRPMFVPMISPPLPWRRVTKQESNDEGIRVDSSENDGSAGELVAVDGQPGAAE